MITFSNVVKFLIPKTSCTEQPFRIMGLVCGQVVWGCLICRPYAQA